MAWGGLQPNGYGPPHFCTHTMDFNIQHEANAAAKRAAIIDELAKGRMLLQSKQHQRELACAQEADKMRGHKALPGLGKCVLNIPAHEFFLIRDKYGPECFDDRGFVKDMQRLEPALAPNKL